ncbi:hypothetical protein R50072_15400 [Simiduia litorea]
MLALVLLMSGCAATVHDSPEPIQFETASRADLINLNFTGSWGGVLYHHQMYASIEDVDPFGSLPATLEFGENEVLIEYESGFDNDFIRMVYFRHKTNVTFGFMDSDTESGEWVESQWFIVTAIDNRHLWVYRARIVNNVDMDVADPISKFAQISLGVFTRRE